jgi:uncharacterized protein YqjF (DUF2071 family)
MAVAFLTARWENLCLLSYAVPPDLLRPRLPPGLELDTRDGRAFVSLVAFNFRSTRVLGVPWPGFRNFDELNLRLYARHGAERGVVFLREFVPQWLVATLARVLYNEPYRAAPVRHTVTRTAEAITAECRLTWAGRDHRLKVTAAPQPFRAGEDSLEQFFKEHHWGFNTDRRGRTIRYRVDHPVWDVYHVTGHDLDFDCAAVYGPEWGFLTAAQPYSVAFAVGSAIAVMPFGKL